MKFSHREDICAPIDFVFDVVSDFDGHERQAMRRGIEIERSDSLTSIGPGLSWNASFPYRGRQRQVMGRLDEYDVPNGFRVKSVSAGLQANFDLELVALAKNRTRMKIGLDLRPDTMKARLFIQSLKLAKARLDRQFRMRMAKFAEDIETRRSGDAVPPFGAYRSRSEG